MINRHGRRPFNPINFRPKRRDDTVGDENDTKSKLPKPDFKPDFLKSKTSDETQATPTKSSISSSYDQIRAELANPESRLGPLTEKQKLELGWKKHQDPIGYRDQLQTDRRVYGNQIRQSGTSAPSKPSNFNGPRRKF